MKSIEILSLAIRLLGIYFLIEGVRYVFAWYGAYLQFENYSQDKTFLLFVSSYMMSTALFVVSGAAFVKFPVAVSKLLLPRSSAESPVFSGNIDDIKIAAFIVIGVYMLSWGIPKLMLETAKLFLIHSMSRQYDDFAWYQKIADFMVAIIDVVIGVVLAVRAKGVLKLVNQLRG